MQRALTVVAFWAGAFSCAAQADLLITVDPFAGTLGAEFRSPLPAGATGVGTIWSDVSFRITGDGPITIDTTTWNQQYDSFFGPPVITGNGTSAVTFVAIAPGPLLGGSFDSSNPLSVMTFQYGGSASAFGFELVGQNSAAFTGGGPFGLVLLYQDSAGNPGDLSFEVAVLPAPGAAAVLGLGGVLAARRRR
jgi:hypothetical protein